MNSNNNLSLPSTEITREDGKLLDLLLRDHTTGDNIKWATDSYFSHGDTFHSDQEIKKNLVTGWYEGFIRPRATKKLDTQLERQRNKAEVFTPSWIIKLQVDAALEEMKGLPLLGFIQTKWLEITCGEAPYMVNRYDMDTGNIIPLKDRSGFIDKKFQRLNTEIESENEWIKLATEIYKASYGYEYQGDSLLLARENLILTFFDNYFFMFGAFPDNKLIYKIANIISLNVFQMDGLTYEVPYSDGVSKEYGIQLSLFDEIEVEEEIEPKLAEVKLWQQNIAINFKEIAERTDSNMKFDVVIGNPPYQIEDGGAQSSARPIYQHFVESGKLIAKDYLSLIIPTRWYVGGKGLNSFRENMLNDTHIKELHDYLNPKEVFPNTNIRGGVCFFLRDANYDYSNKTRLITYKNNKVISDLQRPLRIGNSDILIRDTLAPGIIDKALTNEHTRSISSIVSARKPFGFSGSLTKDERFKSTNEGLSNPIACYGRGMKKGYIEQELVLKNIDWINRWKLFTPRANNIGTELSDDNFNAHIMGPKTICTESYIVIGAELNLNQKSVTNLGNYLQTKFARYLHGIAKASHDASAKTYQFIPIQDFTENSDIDWSVSRTGIDQQLYTKYELTSEEINHIEQSVKEME